jgi:hypothetical protein
MRLQHSVLGLSWSGFMNRSRSVQNDLGSTTYQIGGSVMSTQDDMTGNAVLATRRMLKITLKFPQQ